MATSMTSNLVSATAALPPLPAGVLPTEAWADWLRTGVGTLLDATMVEAMRRVVDAALMPRPADLPQLRAAAAPFVSEPLLSDPRRFFAFVDAPADPIVAETRYRRSLAGGRVIGRRFTAPYTPYAGVAQPDPVADGILVEHWMHERRRPRATVLALHGFSMGQPRIDAWALFASQWFAHGLDVALMTLPYHGGRAPRGTRFSGQRFAEPNPAVLNDAVRRAIYDIHVVRAWLRAQTEMPVGLLGLSLGGYLSSLAAGLVGDLDFVMPMVPPVCMGDLAWRFFSRSRAVRGQAAAYSLPELRAMYRVHSPLTYPLRVPRERVLIIAGRGDRIVPPEHPHALWCHWGEPGIHWFSGSHLAPFGRDRIVGAMVEHLRRLAILEPRSGRRTPG